MYLEFFCVREKPFNTIPRSEFFFFSMNHQEALANVSRGIQQGCGVVLLIGEVGAGKTTICSHLISCSELDTIYACNPFLKEEEFLRRVHTDMGIPTSGNGSVDERTGVLRDHLRQRKRRGKPVVLFIDEAHLLGPTLLEKVLILSSLQMAGLEQLQIVLVGQPELLDMLRLPPLASLNQRIGARYYLKGMDRADTTKYVRHRLRSAGCATDLLFTDRALETIWKVSRGMPGLINQLCDRALMEAYRKGRKRVSRREVKQIGKDPLYWSLLGSKLRNWSPKNACACLVLGLALCLGGFVASGYVKGLGDVFVRNSGDAVMNASLRGRSFVKRSIMAKPEYTRWIGNDRVGRVIYAKCPIVAPMLVREGGDESTSPRLPANMKTWGEAGLTTVRSLNQEVPLISSSPATEALSPAKAEADTELDRAKLSAIAWDDDEARRLAVINDQILHEGDFFGRARIMRIHPNYVLLLVENEHFIMRMDALDEDNQNRQDHTVKSSDS